MGSRSLFGPVVVFCADGTAYYIGLEIKTANEPHRIVIYDRPSGATSWNGPRTVVDSPGTPIRDKPWPACDTTAGPFSGRLYVTWTDLAPAVSAIRLRYSTDHGTTWSGTVSVSDDTLTQSSYLAIGPDGAVNIARQENLRMAFDRSANGGVSFGTDSSPATFVPDNAPQYRAFPALLVDDTVARTMASWAFASSAAIASAAEPWTRETALTKRWTSSSALASSVAIRFRVQHKDDMR